MNISTLILVIAVTVTAFTAFIAYLSKKEITIKDNELLTEKANFYLDLLLVTVDEIVKATNQTIVDKLKEDGDGKLTKEEAEDVFNHVKDEIFAKLTEEAKEILKQVIDDLPAFVDMLIEASVKRNKM